MKPRTRLSVALSIVLLSLSTSWAATLPDRSQTERQTIIVELADLPPLVVAARESMREGREFVRTAHERAIFDRQDRFLERLRVRGIDFTVTEEAIQVPLATVRKPHRFGTLINAIGLRVPAADVDVIRRMAGVKHVTIDEPVRLALDHSVQYIRGNDGPGNKTIFTQNGGFFTRFDGSGQVIAVLDTGIEHSHPAFDTTKTDGDFLSRTGDLRPVRLAGQPYLEGVNHPKVVYFLSLTATTNEDDVGHGTHGAADSAGLKVRGPGLDRIPGNGDDQIIEGVAPGALLMNYKVCETVFTCVGTINIITALEDAVSPTDINGNPKPIATVINMSFGGSSGNPNDASAVAASNAALAGAVPVASAGNAGPNENTHGSPAAGRRVIGVAATNDPGALTNEVDVMPANTARYGPLGASTGAQNDSGVPKDSANDRLIKAILMGGAPDVTFPLGQNYVYCGFADTPDQVPDAVRGRIALASRGSTVTAGGQGTGLFGNKAAEAAAKGAVALLIFNNVPGELEAATTQAAVIPVYGISQANGEYLMSLGFQSPTFDRNNSATWGTLSNSPVRINLTDPSTFSAATTGFSSRGPLDNFRYVKPDVTAPGQNIYAATIPAGGVSTGGGSMSDPSRYISVSGTSFSGPHVAGTAALVRQALLKSHGHDPIGDLALRGGLGTSTQQTQNGVVTASMVRAAIENTATNLREIDGETIVSNTDNRTLIHEIGSGLVHVKRAVDARAALGTNDANGPGGPDNALDPDFLPSHSFGQNVVINTGVAAQVSTISVTLQNTSGIGGGTYALSLLDGGAFRGDVTNPIVGTTGFSVALSTASVSVGPAMGNQATFNVTVTVDGRPAPVGLAIDGADDNGAGATEFLWWVVATPASGPALRMPFFYRAVAGGLVQHTAPFQNAIQDDATPDQQAGVDQDGNYKLSWTFPPPPEEQPCSYQVEEATTFSTLFTDDAEELLVGGSNSKWAGDTPQWVSNVRPLTTSLSYSVLYTDELNTTLTMQNALALPASTKAVLIFDTFQDTEPDFDYASVEVAGTNGVFVPLAVYTGFFSGERRIDLSGFSGQSVKVRFRFTSDQLISAPAFLGWFIDNIRIENANWTTVASNLAALTYDVTGRTTGTYFYRIAGIFGTLCNELGSYSNIRSIQVENASPPTPVAPTASFTMTPNPAVAGQPVAFDGSASTDNDDVGCTASTGPQHCIVSYFWSFGDGSTATTSTPTTSHTYNFSGTYRVTLTVSDDDGQTASEEQLLQVSAPPQTGEQSTSGGGSILISGAAANFSFNVKRKVLESPSGNLDYDDKKGKVKVSSQSITSLEIVGNRARFSGTCTINKVSGHSFTVEVADNGESGVSDTFQITLDTGYTASGTLSRGNIHVKQ
jgi:hypothetical protein